TMEADDECSMAGAVPITVAVVDADWPADSVDPCAADTRPQAVWCGFRLPAVGASAGLVAGLPAVALAACRPGKPCGAHRSCDRGEWNRVIVGAPSASVVRSRFAPSATPDLR